MAERRNHPPSAVVLAAGLGTRMKSSVPKALQDLCGRPLLRHVLAALHGAGVRRIAAVVGHADDRIRAAFADIDIAWVRQQRLLGTGHALRAASKFLADATGPIVVCCGDAPRIRPVTFRSMLQTHRRTGAACTVLTAHVEDPTGYGHILRDASGRVRGIVEERDASPVQRAIREVNSGAYVFDGAALRRWLPRLRRTRGSREIYLPPIVERLLTAGGIVETFVAPDPYEALGVNSQADLALLGSLFCAANIAHHMDRGVTVVDPATTYIECDVKIGQGAVIHPFTVLRAGCTVGRDCSVGPFAHLRVGARLADRSEVGNFVEVKNSRIGTHSKAKHLAYLGDATLGRDVNIGAGTITANYDGRHKHATFIGNGVHTGSNTVLVAPVRLERGAKTGAGSVVLSGHNVAAGDVVAGVPARSLRRPRKEARR